MYYYIDESGHTGANLFDPDQPMLYYGVLSSPVNLDVLGEDRLRPLRKKFDVKRLHAAELGNDRLATITDELVSLQKAFNLRFDLYRVAKPDHAIVTFFDQVFDQAMNPAVSWTGYWTPMKYVLLLKLAYIFNDEIAKKAWEARIELNNNKAQKALTEVCAALRERVGRLPDARSRQLLSDALLWAEKNPEKIVYNALTEELRLAVMPNVVGFQSVMVGIASRIKKHERKATRITVDRQTQFNKAQKTLAEYYAKAARSTSPFVNGPGLPKIDFSGMPQIPITFASSQESAGLELVDIYLWVFKRVLERQDLHPELYRLVKPQIHKGKTDEMSLNVIGRRWEKWFEQLPEPTESQAAWAKEFQAKEESRRLTAVRALETKSNGDGPH